MWTVGKSSWVHQEGFVWAAFYNEQERGSFKSKQEAQQFCNEKNTKSLRASSVRITKGCTVAAD